jgi:hypothetical protein
MEEVGNEKKPLKQGLFWWLRGRFSFTTQMSGFLFCLAEKALLTQKAPIYR